MDEQFSRYLEGQNFAPASVANYRSLVRRVERLTGIDVDTAWEQGRLQDLMGRLEYTKVQERAGTPHPLEPVLEPIQTYKLFALLRSALRRYQDFKQGVQATTDVAVEEGAPDLEQEGRTFALERDLQSALRENIADLEPGLRVIDGGQETRVDAGLIDILAEDTNGAKVVIELKADTARPAVIAQILAYMSHYAQNGDKVRGIIVAADFDTRVELASKAVPNLSCKRYTFKFSFS